MTLAEHETGTAAEAARRAAEKAIEETSARSGGRSARDYILKDRYPVDPAYLEASAADLGSAGVPKERYFSAEWARLEMEKMWLKTWQFAGHVEEVRNVGDYLVYNLGDRSVLIVRETPDTIRAFVNSCLHRGALLRCESGSAIKFRCPFHGWTWDLSGRLEEITTKWDFPHVDFSQYSLVDIRLEVWNQFIFVNFDDGAPPLKTYLGDLVEQWRDWSLEERHLVAHVRIPVEANWKVALEAFIENYHVPILHPQLGPISGVWESQYDVYPGQDHFNRMVTPLMVPGSSVNYDMEEQEILDYAAEVFHVTDENGAPLQITDNRTARQIIADHARSMLNPSEVDGQSLSDSLLTVNVEYFVFPSFVPWADYGVPLAYHFLPNRDDPEKSWMHFYKWEPGPPPVAAPGGPEIPSVGMTVVPSGMKLVDVPELGAAGVVFDQDQAIMARVQAGMRAGAPYHPNVTLALHQESRIRHYHQTLDKYVTAD